MATVPLGSVSTDGYHRFTDRSDHSTQLHWSLVHGSIVRRILPPSESPYSAPTLTPLTTVLAVSPETETALLPPTLTSEPLPVTPPPAQNELVVMSSGRSVQFVRSISVAQLHSSEERMGGVDERRVTSDSEVVVALSLVDNVCRVSALQER